MYWCYLYIYIQSLNHNSICKLYSFYKLFTMHNFLLALNVKHYIFLRHNSSILFIRTLVNLSYDILSHDIHGVYFNFMYQHIIKFKTSSIIPSFSHAIYFECLIFNIVHLLHYCSSFLWSTLSSNKFRIFHYENYILSFHILIKLSTYYLWNIFYLIHTSFILIKTLVFSINYKLKYIGI